MKTHMRIGLNFRYAVGGLLGSVLVASAVSVAGAQALAPSSITNVPAISHGLPSTSTGQDPNQAAAQSNGLTNGAIGSPVDANTTTNMKTSTSPRPSTLNNGVTNPDTGLNYGDSSTSTDQASPASLGYGMPAITGAGAPAAGATSGGAQNPNANGSESTMSSGPARGPVRSSAPGGSSSGTTSTR